MSRDLRRIEVIDDTMAEVLRRKTPAERLAIGFGLWRSARKLLRGQLASLHPDWDAAPARSRSGAETLPWSSMSFSNESCKPWNGSEFPTS